MPASETLKLNPMTSTLFLRAAKLIVIGALLQGPVACGQTRASRSTSMQYSQIEKFELTAGPCAADDYWITIQNGAFLSSDGSALTVPSGHTLQGDWGASGTAWSSGDDMHTAPERLQLLWFSYAEDKFYAGDFAMPQEKIHQLLRQGSWNIEKNKPSNYNELTVCVLPKGVVVVWLNGRNQVLLGRFQGHETPADFKRYYGPAERAEVVKETQAELPASVQAEIQAGTLSTRQWDEYLKIYPWKLEFAQPLTLYRYAINYINAERTIDPLTRDGLDAYRNIVLTPSAKPLPKQLSLYGQAPHKARYLVRVKQFDQTELRAAAAQLLKAHPASPLTFYFAIDKPYQKATVSLKNEWQQIPLIKAPVEVLSED